MWYVHFAFYNVGLIQYNKQVNSLEIIMDVLLSISSTLIALAAALSQCEEDFNEEVDHIPKSFNFTQFYM